MKIVVLGLSITSSWGNGHATNYRALLNALRDRGHNVLFLERDVPWYASTRDFEAPYVELYSSLDDLTERFDEAVRSAELVVVGSFVPDGVRVGRWVQETAEGPVAFWDIDMPVTAAKLAAGDYEYLTPELARNYDLYLSFTGGPVLDRLAVRRARPFYCMVDPQLYHPTAREVEYALGYLGTYSADRQQALAQLLLAPASLLPSERFAVAGPQYPESISWPANVVRIDHLPPHRHRDFYASQRLTLNVTRAAMVEAGWSPSVRLFEAAACGVPIVSDWWHGLDSFFVPGEEILVAQTSDDVVAILTTRDPEELRAIGAAARRRVLSDHTAERRAEQLEAEVEALVGVPT